MELSSARHGDILVLSPSGRIDHARAEAFKTALGPHLARSGPRRPLVLDLGAVDYISSAGLRVLMLASRQARAQGGTIVVATVQPLGKFTLVFPCFATVAEALADPAVRSAPG
jgi:anti-sigma B factor antagonist